MRKIWFVAGALALLAFPISSESRWGPGGCDVTAMSPVGGSSPTQLIEQRRNIYEWRRVHAEPDQAYLYLDGRQIGGWDATRQRYRRLIDFAGSVWGPEDDHAPIDPPADLIRQPGPPIGKLQAFQLNGVKPGEICKHERHTINGRPVAEAVAVAELIDDSKKLWLSVWAKDPAKREAVVNDLKKNADMWKWVTERCHLYAGQAARPDHFLTHDREGKALYAIDGEPTICLQDPAGVELWHDCGYTDGPKSFDAMRKCDPAYRPEDSPGPNRGGGEFPIILILAAAFVVALIALSRPKETTP